MGKWLTLMLLWMSMAGIVMADGNTPIKLPPPEATGGMPLMDALQARHSTREFDTRLLPPQLLSNLLWAASGVNRADSGKRTAPSARDWREIDVYATLADGTYRYDPPSHSLYQVSKADLRKMTGVQDFVATAPLNLVYVANLDRMDTTAEHRALYSATDTGFIAQNVYLFCASAGLATVVRGSVDRETLAAALGLGPQQQIVLAQTVGYPKH
jgi:SagB-type dehydrogenase family enzyme